MSGVSDGLWPVLGLGEKKGGREAGRKRTKGPGWGIEESGPKS